jgi:hypothetical protein
MGQTRQSWSRPHVASKLGFSGWPQSGQFVVIATSRDSRIGVSPETRGSGLDTSRPLGSP